MLSSSYGLYELFVVKILKIYVNDDQSYEKLIFHFYLYILNGLYFIEKLSCVGFIISLLFFINIIFFFKA
jgi:hypothetical protein